jgi:phosphoribosylglycinamide formyltransferase-1
MQGHKNTRHYPGSFMTDKTSPAEPLPIVILISGYGSNLQAIIDAVRNGELPVAIRGVISNRPDAYGLVRAKETGIPTKIIDHTLYQSRGAFDHALQEAIASFQPALVILAGFMRILGPELINRYQGRMMNIHPSLLPAYPGLDTHQRVIDAQEKQHGTSVHFVTNELDSGPVIIQAHIKVTPGDDVKSLASRIQALEHRIYPVAVKWFAQGRLEFKGNKILLDKKPLIKPVEYQEKTMS